MKFLWVSRWVPMGPYGIPMGFLDLPTTKDVLRCWSVRPCVVIVVQSFSCISIGIFQGSCRFPLGVLWDFIWWSCRFPLGVLWDLYWVHDNDDNDVVAVVVAVVADVVAVVSGDDDDGDGEGNDCNTKNGENMAYCQNSSLSMYASVSMSMSTSMSMSMYVSTYISMYVSMYMYVSSATPMGSLWDSYRLPR